MELKNRKIIRSLMAVVICLGIAQGVLLAQTNSQPALDCFISVPSLSVDYQNISDRVESFPGSIRGIEAVKAEGNAIANGISVALQKIGIQGIPVWGARGFVAKLTTNQIRTLPDQISNIQIEILEAKAEPVKTRIENAAPSATLKPIWNQILSGASILASERNLTGKNILIGVLGPDYPFDHPCIEKKIPYYRRFGPPPGVSGRPNPDDLALLHPIGIVAGNHPEVEMCGAPESQLALAIVPHGAVQTEDLLNGIQWLMEPEKGHVPAAILICVDFNTVAPKAVRQILRACRNAGILPIIPAGNNPNRITGMAALPECITVGALDQWKARALFSGQGPAVIDQIEIVKPDLAEPGVGILGPSLGSNGYRFGTGTLQAAAHFAGIWAQMRESKPLVDTETMLAALATTTRDLATPGPDNQTGLGLVDPSAALFFIENPPPPPVPVP